MKAQISSTEEGLGEEMTTAAPPTESSGASHEEIARRAYAIYLARNGEAGDALSDWLQAERELSQGPEHTDSRATDARPRPMSKRSKAAPAAAGAEAAVMTLAAPFSQRADSVRPGRAGIVSAFAPIFDGPYAVFELH